MAFDQKFDVVPNLEQEKQKLFNRMYEELMGMLEHVKLMNPDLVLCPDVSALLERDMLNSVRRQKITDFEIPPIMRFDPHFLKMKSSKPRFQGLNEDHRQEIKESVEYKNLLRKIKSILTLKQKKNQDDKNIQIAFFDCLFGSGKTPTMTADMLYLIAKELHISVNLTLQSTMLGEDFKTHERIPELFNLRYPIVQHRPTYNEKRERIEAKIGAHGVMPPYPTDSSEKIKEEVANYSKLIMQFGDYFKNRYQSFIIRDKEEVHYSYDFETAQLLNEKDENTWMFFQWGDFRGSMGDEKMAVVDINPDEG